MKYSDLALGIIEAVFKRFGGMRRADRSPRGELELVKKTVENHHFGCGADFFIPEGWEVVEHQKDSPFDFSRSGQFEWGPGKVEFYLHDDQRNGSIEGNELRKKLEGEPVLNACVLDYLLNHSELIPEEWKSKWIFFWGTIYRHPGGGLVVRYLRWDNGRWGWGTYWLGGRLHGNDLAALLPASVSGE